MTIVTKVGVSYDDHMNDDAPEVDSFTRECYQALSSPSFMRREPGNEANPSPSWKGEMGQFICPTLPLRWEMGQDPNPSHYLPIHKKSKRRVWLISWCRKCVHCAQYMQAHFQLAFLISIMIFTNCTKAVFTFCFILESCKHQAGKTRTHVRVFSKAELFSKAESSGRFSN